MDQAALGRQAHPQGILDVEDAQLAANSGADALIVSNHGGRQLDGAMSSIAAVPSIADAVGSKIEVWMDGGVRSGQDILGVGARGAMIGRAFLYGLGATARTACAACWRSYKEMDTTMALCGRRSIVPGDRSILLPGTYPV